MAELRWKAWRRNAGRLSHFEQPGAAFLRHPSKIDLSRPSSRPFHKLACAFSLTIL
ncbi:MAG: hypothetical protein ACK4NV_01335 [Pannonibacter sp.]